MVTVLDLRVLTKLGIVRGVLALRPYNEHENLHYDNEYEYSYELPKPRGK